MAKDLFDASLVHEFSNPTWIENLFVCADGQVLLADLSKPHLYLLNPDHPSEPTLVHSFAPSLGVLGIAEVSLNVFYVISGDYDVSTVSNNPGSYIIWSVDLTHSPKADVKKVIDFTEASFLNGMTKIPSSPHVLIADSTLGLVWSLNTESSKHEVAIDVEEMKIPPPPGFPLAINGVKVHNGYLYWTNSGRMLVCRVKIDRNGKKDGEVEILAEKTFGDDIAIDERGVWVSQGMLNTVALVKEDGKGGWETEVVAGVNDQLTVAGATACAFGRKKGSEKILYVSTNGGLAGPVLGKTMGGSLVAVDTNGY